MRLSTFCGLHRDTEHVVQDTEVQISFLHMCVALWKFSVPPECQVRRCSYRFTVHMCGTMKVRRQGTPEVFLHPGGAVHMYMALRPFNCTSGEPCCSSISSLFLLLVNELSKFMLFQQRHRQIWNHLASISLILFSMSKSLNSHTYLVTLSL